MNVPDLIAAPPISDVLELLHAAALPHGDIDAGMLAHFTTARRDGRVVGVVGLEPYGRVGLLRSLAVRDSVKGAGLGRTLVAEAERRAAALGIETLYLLTNTAADYFRRLGFRDVPRDAAPAAIRSTGEFSTLCPEDAAFMRKRL